MRANTAVAGNMTSDIVIRLFDDLKREKVNYAVLRGYEDLPQSYHNDLDFGVEKNYVLRFLAIIRSVAVEFDLLFEVNNVRLDVIQLAIYSKTVNIDVDIWVGFNYGGLVYLDHASYLESARTHNGIKVLSLENELALSYLKELLHMNRIREDKLEILRERLGKVNDRLGSNVFSKSLNLKFVKSIKEGTLGLNSLSLKAKLQLVKNNVLERGLLHTIGRVIKFIRIKQNKKKLTYMFNTNVEKALNLVCS